MTKWKTHRPLENSSEVDRRKRPNLLYAPHVAELNKLVERIRQSKVGDDSVPWFDPVGAGVKARVLILAQDPSAVAAGKTEKGTGFISPDNPDPTADNSTFFSNMAKLKRDELIHWTIVPWAIDGRDKSSEIKNAKQFLKELLGLLPQLEVVICMGQKAEQGWNEAYPDNQCIAGWTTLPVVFSNKPIVLTCPHPSFQSVDGKHRPVDNMTPSERIDKTLRNARIILDRETIC